MDQDADGGSIPPSSTRVSCFSRRKAHKEQVVEASPNRFGPRTPACQVLAGFLHLMQAGGNLATHLTLNQDDPGSSPGPAAGAVPAEVHTLYLDLRGYCATDLHPCGLTVRAASLYLADSEFDSHQGHASVAERISTRFLL